jgi:hypothetical protein
MPWHVHFQGRCALRLSLTTKGEEKTWQRADLRKKQKSMTIVHLLLSTRKWKKQEIFHGYSVGPKYEFVLRGKGIVERVAGTFSGCCQ